MGLRVGRRVCSVLTVPLLGNKAGLLVRVWTVPSRPIAEGALVLAAGSVGVAYDVPGM